MPHRMRRWLLVCVGIWVLCGAHCASAGSLVVITSPVNGAEYHPGDVIDVYINGAEPVGVRFAMLVAEIPLSGDAVEAQKFPLHLKVSVPRIVDFRSYRIGALLILDDGRHVEVPGVSIVVSGPVSELVSIETEDGAYEFRYIGESDRVGVLGLYKDGSRTRLNELRGLNVMSSNPAVVKVDRMDRIIAVGPGVASVTATYMGRSVSVSVRVASSGVRGDLNGDGVVDISDVNILAGAMNQPVFIAGDARDLNGDRVIDALDARIIVTLCKRPRCAIQ